MSRGVNKVILIGHLGKDPEVRHTQSGQAIATLSVATSESWTDKQNGQKQEKTEWHRVVAWGKSAENAGKYLSKGRQVYIEGKLQTREWQDKEGQKRFTTEIVAQDIQFIGGGAGGNGRGAGDPPPPGDDFAPPPGGHSGGKSSGAPSDDDIPF